MIHVQSVIEGVRKPVSEAAGGDVVAGVLGEADDETVARAGGAISAVGAGMRSVAGAIGAGMATATGSSGLAAAGSVNVGAEAAAANVLTGGSAAAEVSEELLVGSLIFSFAEAVLFEPDMLAVLSSTATSDFAVVVSGDLFPVNMLTKKKPLPPIRTIPKAAPAIIFSSPDSGFTLA